jgi:hypothetical protein
LFYNNSHSFQKYMTPWRRTKALWAKVGRHQGKQSTRKAVTKESRHQEKPSPAKAVTKESRQRKALKNCPKNFNFLKGFLLNRGKKVGFHLKSWGPLKNVKTRNGSLSGLALSIYCMS